jgi:hypothetical protein
MRTGFGLPFVCTLYMQLILEGIVARIKQPSFCKSSKYRH